MTAVVPTSWHACGVPPMGQHLSGQRCRAFWMQTSGTALLAAERCSPVRVLTAGEDSRSAHGLLYFAAVRAWPEDHVQRARLGILPSWVT
jgi:hypothetical protein